MPQISSDAFYLDRQSKQTLQAQICTSVIALIRRGTAVPGAKLPSSRKLAEHLGVSRPTITLAYQELVALGYLRAQNRSAFYVADVPPIEASTAISATKTNPEFWQDRLSNSAINSRRQIVKPANWRSYPYPFIYGQMDQTVFDISAWRDCARRAFSKEDFSAMASDVAIADDPLLVHQIRTQTLPQRGVHAEMDEILVTIGAQNALWLATQILGGPKAHAICENPGYPDLSTGLEWRGTQVTHVNIDDEGLPPEAIPPEASVVFLTPSHQAPTGVTMPLYRRQNLMNKAVAHDWVLVEDEYDFEMNFFSSPRKSLKSMDKDGRVIYVGSFSKSLFPGVRLGYLVADRVFIQHARKIRALMLRHPPGHLQRMVAYFVAHGHYDSHLRRLKRIFTTRRAILMDALHEFDLTMESRSHFGGTSLWVRGPQDLHSSDLAQRLLRKGVLIEPGTPFFAEQDRICPEFRIAYSSIDGSKIREGIALIRNEINLMLKEKAF